MSPEEWIESYRQFLAEDHEEIVIRRYSGTGADRPYFDGKVMARVIEFAPEQLVNGIVIGDQKLIVLHQDLVDQQFPLPIAATANWKAVVRGGPERAIKVVDDNSRRHQGVLIAYELVVGSP